MSTNSPKMTSLEKQEAIITLQTEIAGFPSCSECALWLQRYIKKSECVCLLVGIEPWPSHLLGKCCPTDLQSPDPASGILPEDQSVLLPTGAAFPWGLFYLAAFSNHLSHFFTFDLSAFQCFPKPSDQWHELGLEL